MMYKERGVRTEEGIMQSVSIQEAAGSLGELIDRLPPGEEVVITRDDKPIAVLRATPSERKPRIPGTLKGTVLYIAPDFDAIPEGFEDYVS